MRRQPTLSEVRAALQQTNDVRRHAAARLGIPETALSKLLCQFRDEGHSFPKPDQTMWHKPNWEPTEDEIAAGCVQIQAHWSNRERMMRTVVKVERVEVLLVEFEDDSRDEVW